MRNFQIKSILLGIGIGIVITSIISMIYAAGISTKNAMTREEIILKAKEFGMVDNTALIRQDQSENIETSAETEKKAEGTEKKTGEDQKSKETGADSAQVAKRSGESGTGEKIKIVISPGDTSEVVAGKLINSGLIKDKQAFIKMLKEMGMEAEINIGEFNITSGTDIKEIIGIIAGRK
ncbi:MAG: endolytic transglycosylase MltG [Clostridia bacterium]|nr:endolytic transglycosylase MltG [Clostridia bacterium]